MKSCNLSLRKAIFAKLNQEITNPTVVPVFYNYAPNLTNGNYIVFSILSQREIGTSCSNTYAVNVQFKLYTSSIGGNTGVAADQIAESFYELMYPSKTTILTLEDGFTHFGTQLLNDTITNKIEAGNQVYIDRIINLEFQISST